MNKIQLAGFGELLTVVFIFLKLFPGTPVNAWSWWWVLSPLWIPILLVVIFLVVSLIAYVLSEVIVGIYEALKKKD